MSVKGYCFLYDKKNHTWLLVGIKFLFSCSTRHLTRSLRSLVSYRVKHSKRNSISTRAHVLFSIYLTWSALYKITHKEIKNSYKSKICAPGIVSVKLEQKEYTCASVKRDDLDLCSSHANPKAGVFEVVYNKFTQNAYPPPPQGNQGRRKTYSQSMNLLFSVNERHECVPPPPPPPISWE